MDMYVSEFVIPSIKKITQSHLIKVVLSNSHYHTYVYIYIYICKCIYKCMCGLIFKFAYWNRLKFRRIIRE